MWTIQLHHRSSDDNRGRTFHQSRSDFVVEVGMRFHKLDFYDRFCFDQGAGGGGGDLD